MLVDKNSNQMILVNLKKIAFVT